MKNYIIDGYNLIHRVPELEKLLEQELRTARDRCIELCSQFKRSRGDIGVIELVFDGKSEHGNCQPEFDRGIKVTFSETDEDADRRIVRILEEMGPHPKHVFVVSDDNYVRNQTRAYCVTPVTTAVFYSELTKRKRQVKQTQSGADSSSGKGLSQHDARDVTRNYRQHLGL